MIVRELFLILKGFGKPILTREFVTLEP